MSETTPGRRLHAALLAHGIVTDRWDDCHETYHAAYEAAAREYDAARRDALTVEDDAASAPGSFFRARGCLAPGWVDPGPTGDDGHGTRLDACLADAANAQADRDRLDALEAWRDDVDRMIGVLEEMADNRATAHRLLADRLGRVAQDADMGLGLHSDRIDAVRAEVAALRRDRDGDLIAMGEAGDRLARLEEAIGAASAGIGLLWVAHWQHNARLAALEDRARDGGDPLRRTP